jgi:uncharacterized sporulation protein YeaH/YhbH (DUF444 family)
LRRSSATRGRATRNKFAIREEDKRFKTWEMVTEPQRNAVIFAMRDVSGSMGEFEAYICRSFYFWMLRFLRTKYTNCEIVFITCHTEAKEVDEGAFFGLGESGGTRMSSAYALAMKIIEQRFNPREWNIYPFLFSDWLQLGRPGVRRTGQTDARRGQSYRLWRDRQRRLAIGLRLCPARPGVRGRF